MASGKGAEPVPALLILYSMGTAIIQGEDGGRLPCDGGGLLNGKWIWLRAFFF
jgi:hypothetical protein